MLILGIETSCDETSASIIEAKAGKLKVLSNVVSSQIKIHRKFGGVVPEVAARMHVENIMPVLKQAFSDAKIKKSAQGGSPAGWGKIDTIAVTNGPGLAISLLVGVEAARALAFSLNKKLVAINHIEAHILANWLENKKIKFPVLCLVVSGGHTQLVLVKEVGKYQIVGETIDDAVGEAFDKVAKILGLSYPGGPIISKLAKKGDENKYDFPRPMLKSDNFNFSFSGLKTAVLYKVKDLKGEPIGKNVGNENFRSLQKKLSSKQVADISASFQKAAIDVLVQKTLLAANKYGAKTIMLAGGVSANQKLREEIKKLEENNFDVVLPNIKYSTDNAAMIATAGYFRAKKKDFISWEKIDVKPNLRL